MPIKYSYNTHESWWLSPSSLFDGYVWQHDIAFKISHDTITTIAPKCTIPTDDPIMTTDLIACPGYVDLQVNGGGGVMFNNEPSPAGLQTIGRAHLKYGTTSFLPTFITDTSDKLDLAADAVIKTIGQHGVIGMHIEGPHINMLRKGTHNGEFIRPFDERTLATLERLRTNKVPTMITLAPECLPDPTIIALLVAMGVVVSAGHTDANGEQIRTALHQGLSCFTHLHNAMTPMTSREPGVVGMALASHAWCGIVCDGYHVCDTSLAVSIHAKEKSQRMFIVSDAMSTVGGPSSFILYGEEIFVKDGRLINRQGSLAGAHITMAQSVHHLISQLGLAPGQAIAMATSTPADLLSVANTRIGKISIGGKANIVLLKKDWSIVQTICNGQYIDTEKNPNSTPNISNT